MKKLLIAIIGLAMLTCTLIAVGLCAGTYVNTSSDVLTTKAIQDNFQFELKKPLPSINNSIMQYRVNDFKITPEYMTGISNIYGINLSKDAQWNDISPKNGKLLRFYASGGFIYMDPSKLHGDAPTNLPSKEDSIKIAKNYLKNQKLLPADMDSAYVTPIEIGVYYPTNNTSINYTLAWTVHFNRTINGLKVYGPGQSLNVIVTDNGEINGVQRLWRDVTPSQKINIKTPDQAYSELVKCNNTAVTIPHTNANKVAITDVSLGYYIEEGVVSQLYVDPVYVFKGDEISGDTTSIGTYTAFVKAV